MINYLLIFLLSIVYIAEVRGHSFNNLASDADLQAALMPQELNPTFVSDKDSPWRSVFPLMGRQRRDLEVVTDTAVAPAITVSQSLKLYSRMATCIALAIAAIVEIILYVVEIYTIT